MIGILQRGVYSALAYLASLLSFPYWLARRGRDGPGMLERYGVLPAGLVRDADPAGSLWFHAASVGEAGVLARVVAPLAALTPGLPVVVSTMTATGRDRARQLLGDGAHVIHVPLDAPGIVRRTIRGIHPQVLVVAETELWPNLLRAVEAYGAPVIMVNARLSERAFSRYRLLRPGMAPIMRRLAAVCVKTPEDAQRYAALGVPSHALTVAGDLKFEPLPGMAGADSAERRRRAVLPPLRPVLVAGSTRDGEEDAVLEAFTRVLSAFPDALLVLAPRHPRRVSEVEGLTAAHGLVSVRRTGQRQDRDLGGAQVLLVDTIGELERLYAAGDASFVGGSLVPVGGHNLLEPAGYGVPVLFGPHTGETGGADESLLGSGGGLRVQDARELGDAWRALLDDPARRERMGEAARHTVAASRGALQRVTTAYRRALGLVRPAERDGHTDGGSRGPRVEDEPVGGEGAG